MIRITVELVSAISPERDRHLGTALIWNDATGDAEVGHYEATFSKWGRPKQAWKRGTVRHFPREVRGPWDLLYLALHSAVGKRNKALLLLGECPTPSAIEEES